MTTTEKQPPVIAVDRSEEYTALIILYRGKTFSYTGEEAEMLCAAFDAEP